MKTLTPVQQAIVSEFEARSCIPVSFDWAESCRWGSDIGPVDLGLYKNPIKGAKEHIFWNAGEEHTHLLSILFHEIIHATMRPDRCDRECNGFNEYNLEEIIAESAAKRLMSMFGFETEETITMSEKYIARYAIGATVENLEWCRKETDKAIAYVLQHWLPDFAASIAGIKVA